MLYREEAGLQKLSYSIIRILQFNNTCYSKCILTVQFQVFLLKTYFKH